jgi:hypothetical protein
MSVETLAQRRVETALKYGEYEAVAPPHDWWDWYAAYMHARQAGSTPDEASAAASRNGRGQAHHRLARLTPR